MLLLPWFLRIAAHNFDLLRLNVVLIVKLKVDVLNEERPDFITESVRIQVTLQSL